MDAQTFEKVRRCEDEEAVAHFVLDEVQDRQAAAFIGASTPEEKEAARPVNLLTEGQLTVWAVETFFGEICNGGFDQYFGNQGSDITPHAEASLRRVGLDRYAQIMADARSLWPDGIIPTDDDAFEEAYDAAVDQSDDPWATCDTAVYSAMDEEKDASGGYEFRDALYTYIMSNPDEFIT